VTRLAIAAWLALSGSAPEPLALPGFRLHLVVPEDIEADRLEALARPGVVLWVQTRSNLLKRSIAERVGRAEASYVQVRPPFASAAVRQQFTPRIRPWVALTELDVASYRRWAPEGTALAFRGELSEAVLASVKAVRPQVFLWQPEVTPTAEEWARTQHLPGLEVRPVGPLPPCERPLRGAQRIRLRVPVALVETSAVGCGFALRLEVPPSLSEAEVREVLVRWPGAELWAEVSGDAEGAAAATLVAVLTAAVPAPRLTPPPKAR
jgi:hypothetical protein